MHFFKIFTLFIVNVLFFTFTQAGVILKEEKRDINARSSNSELSKAIEILQSLPWNGGKYFCEAYSQFESLKTSTTTLQSTVVQTAIVTNAITTQTTPTSTVLQPTTITSSATMTYTVNILNDITTSTTLLTDSLTTDNVTATTYSVTSYSANPDKPDPSESQYDKRAIPIPKQLKHYVYLLDKACYYIQFGTTAPAIQTKTNLKTTSTTQQISTTITQTAALVMQTTYIPTTITNIKTDIVNNEITDTFTQTFTATTGTSTITSDIATSTVQCVPPPSLTATITSGQSKGSYGVFGLYYSGTGYVQNFNNDGDLGVGAASPPNYINLENPYVGNTECSEAVQECASLFAPSNRLYSSFDLHFVKSNSTWVCVQYTFPQADQTDTDPASTFNVQNDDVGFVFGYTLIQAK